MERKEFLIRALKSIGLKVVASKTASAMTSFDVVDKNNVKWCVNVFVDKAYNSNYTRRLYIKLKSNYIDKNQDKCYEKLNKFIKNVKRHNVANTAEVVKYNCNPNSVYPIEYGRISKVKALSIRMDDADRPWNH